ncbi:MAG: hypothetical protein R6V85_13205 [Polyangia bacterium]
MTDERAPFMKARFRGARFDGKRLPISILPELNVYTQLIQDLARHLFLQDHEKRKRAPKGFSNAFAPALTGIEDGSAVAVIERSSEPGLLQVGDDYFEKAHALLTDTIYRVGRAEEPPASFPAEFYKRFNNFGKGLRDDETIELRRGDAADGATYTRKVRKDLVLKHSETYQQEVEVVGPIIEAHVEKLHFHIRVGDDVVLVKFSKSEEQEVLKALQAHETMDVSFSGVATFDRRDRILEIDEIRDLTLFESLRPYGDRLEELRELPEGWLDEDGASPTAEAVASAERFRELLERTDYPVPVLFPMPEGGFQAEWSREEEELEVTMCFEPDGSVLLVWSSTRGDGEEQLQPNDVNARRLAQLLVQTGIAEGEQ